MAGTLWASLQNPAEEQIEKGGIFSGVSALQMLEALQVSPDFSYADQEENILDYVHYQEDGLDFYLVSNTTDAWVFPPVYFPAAEQNAGNLGSGVWTSNSRWHLSARKARHTNANFFASVRCLSGGV